MVAQAFAAEDKNLTNPGINMEDDETEWSLSEEAIPTDEQVVEYDMMDLPEVLLKSSQR